MNYLQIELPSLHLQWRRPGQDDVMCSVIRTNYPKPSTLQVAALAREAGPEVKIVDMKIRDQEIIVPYRKFNYEGGIMVASRMGMLFDSVREEILWADVIGLSLNPSSWANIALDFIVFAKNIKPSVQFWLGGTDPMFRPEFFLRRGADLVFRGEVENSLRQVVQSFPSREAWSEIKGLSIINTKDELVDTGLAKGCDLDKSPFLAFDLLTEDKHLWNMNIEGYIPKGIPTPIGFLFLTRGCNQACDFCTTPLKFGRLRWKSLARVEQELDWFVVNGIRTINIWDDSLSSLLKWGQRDLLFSYVRAIKSRGMAYEFSQGMVIKDLWDEEKNEPDLELIRELYEHEIGSDGSWVGCYGEYFPFEFLQEEDTASTNPKLMSYEKELAVMHAVLSQGVKWLTYSCIIGRPEDGETEMILASKRLNEITAIVESYGAKGLATPFVFSVFPGTKLYRNFGKEMAYALDEYPELYQLNATSHGTNNFTPGELMCAKVALEKSVLTEQQCINWWCTGRACWKEV